MKGKTAIFALPTDLLTNHICFPLKHIQTDILPGRDSRGGHIVGCIGMYWPGPKFLRLGHEVR